MAEFYAYRSLAGKTTYSKVHAKLKPAVKAILDDMGFSELTEV